jgi:hypothetical protein
MKKSAIISLTSAAALIAATCGSAFAQGASTYAPGQQPRASDSKGASGSAPGQMQKAGEGDAKSFAPGQQKKLETEGQASGDKMKSKAK